LPSYKRKAAQHYRRGKKGGKKRRVPRRIEEEFRILVNHIIPAREEGLEWIWEETKKMLEKYPELREKVNRWLKEEKDEEGEEEIKRIIKEWEEAAGRRKRGKRNRSFPGET